MQDRWKIGNYYFTVNPNKYTHDTKVIGDTFKALDGTIISQPTSKEVTHRLTANVYQPMARVLSETGFVSNTYSIEFENNKYHILNKSNNVIYRYSKDLTTLEKTTTIPALSSTLYAGIDVETTANGYNYYLIVNNTPVGNIVKIDDTGALLFNKPVSISNVTYSGIQYISGYIWGVTLTNLLYKFDLNGNSLEYIVLPNIPYSSVGYNGITATGNTIILSYGDNEGSGCYHIDTDTGNIINHFSIQNYTDIFDVTIVDGYFMMLRRNIGTIAKVQGNTVLMDLYILEKEIKSNGILSMIDDLDIPINVAISDYSISRDDYTINSFTVNINAQVINRG